MDFSHFYCSGVSGPKDENKNDKELADLEPHNSRYITPLGGSVFGQMTTTDQQHFHNSEQLTATGPKAGQFDGGASWANPGGFGPPVGLCTTERKYVAPNPAVYEQMQDADMDTPGGATYMDQSIAVNVSKADFVAHCVSLGFSETSSSRFWKCCTLCEKTNNLQEIINAINGPIEFCTYDHHRTHSTAPRSRRQNRRPPIKYGDFYRPISQNEWALCDSNGCINKSTIVPFTDTKREFVPIANYKTMDTYDKLMLQKDLVDDILLRINSKKLPKDHKTENTIHCYQSDEDYHTEDGKQSESEISDGEGDEVDYESSGSETELEKSDTDMYQSSEEDSDEIETEESEGSSEHSDEEDEEGLCE